MMLAVASERSIFSKNHDYNSYIKSFLCRGEHVCTYISGSRIGLGELCSKFLLLCYAPMLLNALIMLPRIVIMLALCSLIILFMNT